MRTRGVWLCLFALFQLVESNSQGWKILKKAIDQDDPDLYMAEMNINFPDSASELLPPTLKSERDILALDHFVDYFTRNEDGFAKVISLTIDSNLDADLFSRILRPRKEWVSPKVWGMILSDIRQKSGDKFPEYYHSVLRCFSHIEVLTAHCSPVFTDLTEEPAATLVRLTPFYYIIQNPDEYSEKLRKEFASILMPSSDEPMAKYLGVLELYLENGKYLRRATSNEQEYFNLNKWIYETFLKNPDVVDFIIEHDLNNLAYILFLPGASSALLNKVAKKCAFKVMAMILGKNRPEYVKVNSKACRKLTKLLRLHEALPKIPNMIPCSPIGTSPKSLSLRTDLLSAFSDPEDNLTAVNMLMGRIFAMPTSFVSSEEWESLTPEGDTNSRLQAVLERYCAVYDMKPNYIIAPHKSDITADHENSP